ncbi:MAG: hypothetical protein K0R15_2330 [Clostridiales bacterium]|nr:hypothetical protein [Clostridiales bacterium]
MNTLKISRSIFHSEADFQFALAWEIQKAYPEAEIRLEYCPAELPNMHLDILVEIDRKWFPIELKYKTLKTNVTADMESYNLKTHGAHDLGRYDYWIDVKRIEILKNKIDKFEKGYAVILSNDPSYWYKPSNSRESVCDNFRIHEGNKKTGELNWNGNPSLGTIKNREKPIYLENEYHLNWQEYSRLSADRNGAFNYLLLEIKK